MVRDKVGVFRREKGVKEAERWRLMGLSGMEMCWFEVFPAKIDGVDEIKKLEAMDKGFAAQEDIVNDSGFRGRGG
ncbi:hypothetical protein Hanom_Chr08g00746931 [Helianthus anomalus]